MEKLEIFGKFRNLYFEKFRNVIIHKIFKEFEILENFRNKIFGNFRKLIVWHLKNAFKKLDSLTWKIKRKKEEKGEAVVTGRHKKIDKNSLLESASLRGRLKIELIGN